MRVEKEVIYPAVEVVYARENREKIGKLLELIIDEK